ncbi:MAG: hypothetical protein FWD75_06715 [Propionibacteriaceae bacterium]|nr:hypothetical protein [Propionibacteriaceae bacterium]
MDVSDIILDSRGEFENDVVKVKVKRVQQPVDVQRMTGWTLQSGPKGEPHSPQGQFGAHLALNLVHDELTLQIETEVSRDDLETYLYLLQDSQIIDQVPYSGTFHRTYTWRLTADGDYSVRAFIRKVGSDYRTADAFFLNGKVVFRPARLPQLLRTDEEIAAVLRRTQLTQDRREVFMSAVSAGVDVFAHLKRQGYSRIVAMSDGDLGTLAFRVAYQQGHFIEVVSTAETVVPDHYFRDMALVGLTIRHYSTAFDLGPDVALLILDSDNQHIRAEIARRTRATIIDGMPLITSLLFEKTMLDPLCDFAADRPDVRIMAMSDFGLRYLQENTLSLHEHTLLEDPAEERFISYVRQHCDEPGFTDPVFTVHGKTPDYIRDGFRVAMTRTPDGLTRLANVHSTYVNVINHTRVTEGVPERYKHTIWMLGASKVIGTCADSETIESHLQNLMNSAGLPFAVVNAGSYNGGADEQQWRLLATLPVSSGDIVMPMIRNKTLFDACVNRFEMCDLRRVFQRPHDYGEVFFDTGHVNSIGNAVVAKAIYARLVEAGMLVEHGDARPAVTTISATTAKEASALSLTHDENTELDQFIGSLVPLRTPIGAIVVNCNPFTLGHQHLVQYASHRVDHLYVFVVEEDRSFFPFSDRLLLVQQGVAHLPNVTVLPSGKFIISQRTFPAYSVKDTMQEDTIDPSMDVTLFATRIAPALGITVRFAGEEPLDNVTRQYNDAMKRILPQHGIEFEVIPRAENSGQPISASRVRKLLSDRKFAEIANIVPTTTLDYLVTHFS